MQIRFGDTENLAVRIEWAVAHAEEMVRIRGEVRAEYLPKYTPEPNHELLMELYGHVTVGKKTAKNGRTHAEIVR